VEDVKKRELIKKLTMMILKLRYQKVVKIYRGFIIKRGKINKPWSDTLKDLREVLYPYTAMKLKEGENVKIDNYIKMAGIYEVTHMIVFTSTETS